MSERPLQPSRTGEGELLLEVGWKGGGIRVYGHETEHGWVYWQGGTAMAFDDVGGDGEHWKSWQTSPSPDFENALPDEWRVLVPVYVNLKVKPLLHATYSPTLHQGAESLFERLNRSA